LTIGLDQFVGNVVGVDIEMKLKINKEEEEIGEISLTGLLS